MLRLKSKAPESAAAEEPAGTLPTPEAPLGPALSPVDAPRGSRAALVVFVVLGVLAVAAFGGVLAMQALEYLSYGQPPSVWK
jgi:hypothetical protein